LILGKYVDIIIWHPPVIIEISVYLEQINCKISRTCTANGTPEVGRELRAVISSKPCFPLQ